MDIMKVEFLVLGTLYKRNFLRFIKYKSRNGHTFKGKKTLTESFAEARGLKLPENF